MTSSAHNMIRFGLLAGLAIASLQSGVANGQRTAPIQNAPAERSTALTLTVGGRSRQLSMQDLSALPQSSVTVHNSHSNRDEVYTGVTLYNLLGQSGLPFSKETQQTYLRSYVRAQGTDFYFVIYSAAEINPDLNTSKVIVATHLDAHDLGKDGSFKLVSTGDTRPARWVRNLLSITVVTIN